MKKPLPIFAFILLIALIPAPAFAQRIDPAGIDGAVLLCGAGEVSDAAIDRFMSLAGGAKAKVGVLHVGAEVSARTLTKRLEMLAKKMDASQPKSIDVKDARAALPGLTGVWLMAGSGKDARASWLEAVKDHPLREELLALLKRPGVIATSGSEAAMLDDRGYAILPVLDVRNTDERKKDRSLAGRVGIHVPNGACLLIQGRTLSAIGDGAVTLHLSASKTLQARAITLQGKTQQDLTALRRAAYDRANGFPPARVEAPVVAKGTLVIVGGGGSPEGLQKKFVEYAGGAGKAKIVIFPTAIADPIGNRNFIAEGFKKAGAAKATILKGRTLQEVESKEFLDTLKEATGIWFDGGRQWRFVDAYENTKALPLMFDVLQRGGVIGGTSAGATIQGDYLARGGVFTNTDARYEGYERGLGFLKGVAIDQHFSQRKRLADMTSLMKIYPQYLGIGIDEATAIVVQGSTADVIGKGKVLFYDSNRKVEAGQPDYEALAAGGRYDLTARKILKASPNK